MIISALRAYYADINFENWTDSRSLLDVLTPLELAPSIIVASSPVLGPILKKWFGDENRGPGTATSPKSSNHKFQRIDDNGLSAATPSFQNIELGVRTTAEQCPRWTSLDQPIDGSGQPDRLSSAANMHHPRA